MNIASMKRAFALLAAWLLVPLSAVQAADRPEDITLVKKGGTAYVIYHAAQASASVKEAAKELQRVLEISTRAQLPIVRRPGEFMIVLGDTPETRRAGIDPGKLPEEGFELKSLGGNVFIAGRDTKDGEFTTGGGSSDGTYYGVMEFLERFVGVRWLLPGDGGEDIPVQPTLTLAPIALKSAPDFPSRSMTMTFGAISNPWLRRQRITSSRQSILMSI